MPDTPPSRGLTVADVAARLRVSPDKVRRWIARGLLIADNTSDSPARPRWVIDPRDLEAFRLGRRAAPPKPPRRKKRITAIDFFPD